MKPVPAQSLTRRTFLRQAATAGSLAAATPLWNACSSTGSATASRRPRPTLNDRLRIGFVGLGGRARWILKNEELPGADVVAAADCFLPRLDEASRQVAGGERWRKYQYYQDMLAKEQLDAVFVETTTHARVLIAIHAMQAGLDVYAEKPQSLTVQEGRVLVQAARKYRRIIQTGSQQRSMPINRYASDLVRTGAIGRIHTVITCNFQGPKKWVRKEETPNDMPAGLDWDQWCNQTALRPYYMDLQFKWGELEDYDGGGQMWGVTGWGTHSLDQVQCALGTDDTGPVEIWPEPPGGPDCKITLRYANGTLLKLEGANRSMDDLGAIFVGEHGRIEILRGDFTTDRPELKKDAPPPTPQGNRESIPHIQNFFDSIRSRKKPNADAETGHRATTLCHLINICRTVQRRLHWDPKREQFRDDPAANALLARPRRAGYELPRIA